MQAFHFRLETVLNVRRHQEDLQKQVLQQSLNQLDLNQRKLQGLLRQQMDNFDRLRKLQQGRLNLGELEAGDNYAVIIKEAIVDQETEVRVSEERVQEARSELLEIVKARKILEKLKEKHLEKYNLEALREDQKLIDEMAGVAFSRQDTDQEGI